MTDAEREARRALRALGDVNAVGCSCGHAHTYTDRLSITCACLNHALYDFPQDLSDTVVTIGPGTPKHVTIMIASCAASPMRLPTRL